MNVILNVVLWKYICNENCNYFMLLLDRNPSTTFLVAWKSHEAQQSEIEQECIIVLTIETFMAKKIRFPPRNDQVLRSSLIITIEKKSIVKDLRKCKM